jgi:hypothetical protein
MTPEEIYDSEIAPALLKIATRCKELGFPFVAAVEWDSAVEGQRGRTEFCPKDDEKRPSAAQLLCHYAARSNGNIDSMLMAVMRGARQYGHSSIYLKMLDVPLRPSANTQSTPNET